MFKATLAVAFFRPKFLTVTAVTLGTAIAADNALPPHAATHTPSKHRQARVGCSRAGSLAPFALQQPNVHLSCQVAAVVRLNHLNAGPCISRQGQQVNIAAVQQAQGDGCVT